MKGRDVKMFKIIKPEHKAAMNAALDAALAVMDSDASLKEGRDERLARAKREFPKASEEEIKAVQDLAALHVLIGGILERAAEHSENMLMLVAEETNKMVMMAVVSTMMGEKDEPAPTKVASEADIPNVIPHHMRNMKES